VGGGCTGTYSSATGEVFGVTDGSVFAEGSGSFDRRMVFFSGLAIGIEGGDARASFLGEAECLGDLEDLIFREDFLLLEDVPREECLMEGRTGDLKFIS